MKNKKSSKINVFSTRQTSYCTQNWIFQSTRPEISTNRLNISTTRCDIRSMMQIGNTEIGKCMNQVSEKGNITSSGTVSSYSVLP